MKKGISQIIIIALLVFVFTELVAQEGMLHPNFFTIARIKYSGGGDWYCDPSSLPNLIEYARENAGIPAIDIGKYVELTDEELFDYPYLYISGHGNIKFTDEEVERLRTFLTNGGFLHADDNYGMDQSFRREMKRVFPDQELIEIPFSHDIYHCFYDFPAGLPKIHKHDGKPAQGFGIFYEDRLVAFYSYECDLGDGWEDQPVHNDPPDKREAALKMGTNVIVYSLTH
ncbi:DUF4159 domain-containing protein [bacterium]|nr:DUF4159 domain-containing protein [bacterium]